MSTRINLTSEYGPEMLWVLPLILSLEFESFALAMDAIPLPF